MGRTGLDTSLISTNKADNKVITASTRFIGFSRSPVPVIATVRYHTEERVPHFRATFDQVPGVQPAEHTPNRTAMRGKSSRATALPQ
jgi:hypothetical protein